MYLKRSWMSSRLLPLVSGTKRRQKKKVRVVKPPNSQKALASVTPDTRLGNRQVGGSRRGSGSMIGNTIASRNKNRSS